MVFKHLQSIFSISYVDLEIFHFLVLGVDEGCYKLYILVKIDVYRSEEGVLGLPMGIYGQLSWLHIIITLIKTLTDQSSRISTPGESRNILKITPLQCFFFGNCQKKTFSVSEFRTEQKQIHKDFLSGRDFQVDIWNPYHPSGFGAINPRSYL